MSISRRLRFEILRRDDQTCRYCGQRAPDVALTVDHVLPVTLGGTDEAGNLVAACHDCNSGKAATGPGEHLVADVASDALRWSAAMRLLAEQAHENRLARQAEIDRFDTAWSAWTTGRYLVPRDDGWRASVERWLDLTLTVDDLVDLIEVAMKSRAIPGAKWKYFAGCAWGLLRKRQEQARALVVAEDTPHACWCPQPTPRNQLRVAGEHSSDHECQLFNDGYLHGLGEQDDAVLACAVLSRVIDGDDSLEYMHPQLLWTA